MTQITTQANRTLEALHTAHPILEWALTQNRTMENAEILRTSAKALDAGYNTAEFTAAAEAMITRLTAEMSLAPPVGAAV